MMALVRQARLKVVEHVSGTALARRYFQAAAKNRKGNGLWNRVEPAAAPAPISEALSCIAEH